MLHDISNFIILRVEEKGTCMKKIFLIFALLIPFVCDAAQKPKKEEPVVHLTDEQIYEELKKLAAVFEMARDKFVEEADERKMLEGAMNGMLGALDPHSSYLSKEDFKEFNDKSQGEFGGLGIQITSDKGAIRVISPIDDTPAAKAGIEAGDYITHIDGVLQSLSYASTHISVCPYQEIHLRPYSSNFSFMYGSGNSLLNNNPLTPLNRRRTPSFPKASSHSRMN